MKWMKIVLPVYLGCTFIGLCIGIRFFRIHFLVNSILGILMGQLIGILLIILFYAVYIFVLKKIKKKNS